MSAPYQIKPASCKHKFTFAEADKWDYDENYTYEFKEDGRRYLLQIRPAGIKQNFLTSRGISKKTGLFVEQQDTIPWMRDFKFDPSLYDSVFDGEIVGGEVRTDVITEMKKGNIQYRVWDVLFSLGDDIRSEFYWKRRKRLLSLRQAFPKWMNVVTRSNSPKEMMAYVRQDGREGLVRKNRFAAYGFGWDKVKKADTWDCVIMDYLETNSADFKAKGWIGSIIFGQYKKGKLVEIGRTSGMTQAVRAEISRNQKKYLGRVIEVEAQEQLKSGALAHPRFKRLRDEDEKDPTECLLKLKEDQ